VRVAFERSGGTLFYALPLAGTGYTNNDLITLVGGAQVRLRVRSGAIVALVVAAGGAGLTNNSVVGGTGGTGSGFSARIYTEAQILLDLVAMAATNVVWHYTTSPAYVAALKALGVEVQGTLSGQITYNDANTDLLSAAALGFDQQPVPVGFLLNRSRTFVAEWRPGARAYQVRAALTEVARNLNEIQYDDPNAGMISGNSVTPSYRGGCFDPETLAAWGRPNFVAELALAGVTQDSYNWTSIEANQGYLSTSSTWPANSLSFPGYADYIRHLKRGVIGLHEQVRAALGDRLYTINASSPYPKANSVAWMIGEWVDGITFETDSTAYSGASLGNRARFASLFVHIATARAAALASGVGKVVRVHLRPLRNDSTNTCTRADQVALLLRQYALCYALGATPTYPLDTFQFVWADGQDNDRFSAEPGDGFYALSQFVRASAELFDTEISLASLLLAYDVSQDSQTEATILDQGEAILRNGVPAGMYLLGESFQRDPVREARATRIVRCSTGAPVSQIAGTNAIDLGAFGTGNWPQLSAATLSGTYTDVVLVPKLWARGYLCHIVNFDAVTRAGLTLTVPRSAMPADRPSSAWWFEPGQLPRRLRMQMRGDSVRVNLPTLTVWGIVVLESA
jgi:hypothetical protein